MARVGRTRRRGEANRSRGRSPRIRNRKHKTYMMTDKATNMETLPPQGNSRSPSDRQAGSTVPGACRSSTCAGPTPLLPTGMEVKDTTAANSEEEMRDPLDLTFVDCPSTPVDEEGSQRSVLEQAETIVSTPSKTPKSKTKSKIKRKARVSPEVITPSDEERDVECTGSYIATPVAIRRTRSRKKRQQMGDIDITKGGTDASSSRMSTESERSDLEDMNTSKKAAKAKKNVSVIVSSEDEDTGQDFAPQDLQIMGAINAGAVGLDCLANVERMRAKSKNLQGGISGKMRKDLERAKEVMNTLILKAEATGDPAFLRLKNRELVAEIEKHKLEELRRQREMDDMKNLVESLRKEVMELRDKLDEAEEDRRKARESLRWAEWKAKKENREPLVEAREKEQITEGRIKRNLEEEGKVPIDLPVMEIECAENLTMNILDPGTGKLVSSAATGPGKEKEKEEIGQISKEIKELRRKEKELMRRKNELSRTEESETGSERQGYKEKPLPQRIPRMGPRVIANVQLAPPRAPPDFRGRAGGLNKDRDRDRDKAKEEDTKDRNDNKKDWVEVRNRKGDKRSIDEQTGNLSVPYTINQTSAGFKVKTPGISSSRPGTTRRAPKSAAVLITGCS